jgi:hypothetical protein
MNAAVTEFEWYDAWVLAAVVYSYDDAPAPLWQVIWTADALNKAIVSRGELEFALERLVRAEYVRVTSEGWEPTEKALELKAPGPPVEHIASAIGAREWSPHADMPRTTSAIYVTPEAYNKALKKYRKEFGKRFRTLRDEKDESKP